MKNVLLIVVGLFVSLNAAAQNEVIADVVITDALSERNEVSFTQSALNWDDFKGKPDKNSEWTAMTYSGIKLRYEYKRKNDQYTVTIMLYPYMDKTRSWYREEGYNDYTLAHEQRHFDITILVTKQLARELRQMSYSPKTFTKQINKIHGEYLEKLRQMQDQYDEQTKHGMNKSRQQMWDKKIETELGKLKAVN